MTILNSPSSAQVARLIFFSPELVLASSTAQNYVFIIHINLGHGPQEQNCSLYLEEIHYKRMAALVEFFVPYLCLPSSADSVVEMQKPNLFCFISYWCLVHSRSGF